MKKIIGLFTILLITTSVFGQIFLGDLSIIESIDITEKTDVKKIPYVNFVIEDLGDKYLYLLAYEPNFPNTCYEGTIRNVYLYRKNMSRPNNKFNNWIRVSDAIDKDNFYFKDSNNYRDIDFFKFNNERHNTSSSHVNVEGKVIIFTVEIHTMKNGTMLPPTIEKFVLSCYERTLDGNLYMKIK